MILTDDDVVVIFSKKTLAPSRIHNMDPSDELVRRHASDIACLEPEHQIRELWTLLCTYPKLAARVQVARRKHASLVLKHKHMKEKYDAQQRQLRCAAPPEPDLDDAAPPEPEADAVLPIDDDGPLAEAEDEALRPWPYPEPETFGQWWQRHGFDSPGSSSPSASSSSGGSEVQLFGGGRIE